VRLFIRLKDGLALTDEGNAYFPGIRSAVMELRHSTEHLQEANNNSVLTISTLVSVASKWLLPRLPLFREAFPEIDVRRRGAHCEERWQRQGLGARDLHRQEGRAVVDSETITLSANEEGLPMWQAFVWRPASAAGFLSSQLSNFHLRMFLRSIFPTFDARGVLSPYSFAESKNSQAAE
jgi:hypothetical protein